LEASQRAATAAREARKVTRSAPKAEKVTTFDVAKDSPAQPSSSGGSGLSRRPEEISGLLSAAETAAQWNPAKSGNSYSSTAAQYLYAIYSEAGDVLKYGTTKFLGPEARIWAGRYTLEEFADFGSGAYMEILNQSTARVIREAERKLIKGYEFISGKRPDKNKVYH
jgi:hypothetical protein